MRRLHSLFGLVAALVVVFMASTGAILALQPALEAATAGSSPASANAAQLAAKADDALSGLERITRSANGLVVAYYESNGTQQAAQLDPNTGAVLGPYQPSSFFSFMTELHRSLFLGDAGHGVAGIAALGIAVLAVSGIVLVAKRMGGWRHLFGRVKGEASQRLHTSLARVAVFGLAVTALSGLYMTGLNFGFIPDGSAGGFALTPAGSGGTPATIATLQALADTPLSSLRELVFPTAGNAKAVFTLTTSSGVGYVDPAAGSFIKFTPNDAWQQLYETVYLLHTGQGAWWLGLVLGGAALAVPALALTGVLMWLNRRRQAVRLVGNSSWRSADTVILYGTETNTTLGFAASVHDALVAAGHAVHTAPMNSVRAYPKAERLLVLTSTYGDGTAPASANRFLSRLERVESALPPYAVLGFGDRSFAHYCAFAETVDAAIGERAAAPLLLFTSIDRQSEQDFATWAGRLGEALGEALAVTHTPARPRTYSLVLDERLDYGIEVQAPIAVLRFVAPAGERGLLGRLFRRSALPRFEAGDLVGIIPPGSTVPRYYSLASSSSDGGLEICVRRQANGTCSEFLHGLARGDTIDAFVRRNPDFRPVQGRRPMILVGAGAGIAPLAGFVRHNRHRPTFLFFGARHPRSDFLYRDDLEAAVDDGRLDGLDVAFSRVSGGSYVQDRVAANAELIRGLVRNGAEIFVCGGLEMARGVRDAFDQLLAPLGMTADSLKAHGRYFEDAY